MKKNATAMYVFALLATLMSKCVTTSETTFKTISSPSPNSGEGIYIAGVDTVAYGKVEIKPQLVNIPSPKYPDLARKEGAQGIAKVKALVDVDGSIMAVFIFQSSGHEILDQAALEAVKKAEFVPAQLNDKPVRVWVTIPLNFKLSGH